jgi:hypothetical protein
LFGVFPRRDWLSAGAHSPKRWQDVHFEGRTTGKAATNGRQVKQAWRGAVLASCGLPALIFEPLNLVRACAF